jgi:hypothetical protein
MINLELGGDGAIKQDYVVEKIAPLQILHPRFIYEYVKLYR